jgi:hypothetical protein
VLSWTSTNADYCVIEPGIGSVEPSGSIGVSPAQTTEYTITRSRLGGRQARPLQAPQSR